MANRPDPELDLDYPQLLIRGARVVAAEISGWSDAQVDALPHRETMRAVKALVAVYVATGGARAEDRAVLDAAPRLLAHLAGLQRADGLFDSENLASPPDTCFTINDVCLTVEITRRHPHPSLDAIGEALRVVALGAVDALLVGGVHTPNHRWELAAALVHLDALWPDPRLVARAEQWLAEGIDVGDDGLYSERSPNYAAYVSNPSLLTIAAHGERVVLDGVPLDREALVDVVRRNLDATLVLLEDDLSVETVQSRRQDQKERFDGRAFLSQLRHLAIRDGDGRFAGVVRSILELGASEPEQHLAEALADPSLTRPLPPTEPLPSSVRRVFAASGLVRVRDDRTSVSVFGGSDYARFRRVASGLANSSTILRVRHGAAVVEAVRLSPHFFGLGAFRSDGLDVDADGRYVLHQDWAASYHQPLPAGSRRASGSYDLEGEGRFFGAMSFAERPGTPVTLSTRVVVTVDGPTTILDLAFDGIDTSFAVELVLRPGGELTGARPRADGSFELADGVARYRVGDDVIELGPGNGTGPRQPAVFDPGEIVDYVGGSDTVPGLRVYITGRTVGPHRLTLTGTSA